MDMDVFIPGSPLGSEAGIHKPQDVEPCNYTSSAILSIFGTPAIDPSVPETPLGSRANILSDVSSCSSTSDSDLDLFEESSDIEDISDAQLSTLKP